MDPVVSFRRRHSHAYKVIARERVPAGQAIEKQGSFESSLPGRFIIAATLDSTVAVWFSAICTVLLPIRVERQTPRNYWEKMF
jgi:hypothetical protein